MSVDHNSSNLIESIGIDKSLRADFGTTYRGEPKGIPYVLVTRDQKKVPIKAEYASQSAPGPNFQFPRTRPH